MTQHKQGDHTPDKDVLSRAQAVAGKLKERAFAVDRAREIPVETVRELHEAGLLTGSIPRSLGGTEIDLITLVAVLERANIRSCGN